MKSFLFKGEHQRTKRADENVGAITPYSLDYSDIATKRGTTVSSVVYSGSGLAISNTALSSGVSTFNLTTALEGQYTLKATVTMADSTTAIRYIEVTARDQV